MSTKWLTPIAYIGATWYALGLVRFFLRFTLDSEGVVIEVPIFILVLFAASSIVGFIATQLLFEEPRDAFWAFLMSLCCSIGGFGWVLVTMGVDFDAPFSTIAMPIIILAVSTFYTVYSWRMHRDNTATQRQSN